MSNQNKSVVTVRFNHDCFLSIGETLPILCFFRLLRVAINITTSSALQSSGNFSIKKCGIGVAACLQVLTCKGSKAEEAAWLKLQNHIAQVLRPFLDNNPTAKFCRCFVLLGKRDTDANSKLIDWSRGVRRRLWPSNWRRE